MKLKASLSAFFLISFISYSLQGKLSYSFTTLDKNTTNVTITIPVQGKNHIFHDSISFSVDHPDITLSEWQTNQKPHQAYDKITKTNKKIYDKDITISLKASKQKKKVNDAYLYVSYQTNNNPYPQEKFIPLHFAQKKPKPQTQGIQNITPTHQKKPNKEKPFSFSSYVSNLIKSTEYTSLKFLLIFFLGFLLSLTPCIYPMIPITIGILQSQSGSSFLRNTIMALCYTFGLATTYACLGLLVGLIGPVYGYIFSSPIFVLLLVAFLLYCALSMMGFYQMYTPRFLQPNNQGLKNKSFFSAFLFGAASGTIASPCVSPGLALVLSVVATLKNSILSFLLLFVFGLGLSMPLLIIGIFSSSLNMLPRAGLWMEEVKKFFGLLIIVVCFYFLKMILPFSMLLWTMAITITLCGIFYLYHAQHIQSKTWKRANNLVGFILLASSILIYSEAYQVMVTPPCQLDNSHACWYTNFDKAITDAKTENKYLFVDVWAQFCSICLTINKTVLKDQNVLKELSSFVLVSIDATQASSEPYATIQKKFGITGFPTFLIIDPETLEVKKRWNSKIYSMPRAQFIQKLKKYKKA